MNSIIISSLKKRKKYVERFYDNPSDYNKDLLNDQASACTKLINQAKVNHVSKISTKLENPDTAPKTCWSIISRFLNKRKRSVVPPFLNDGKLVKLVIKFEVKSELFYSHSLPSVFQSKIHVHYQSLNIELTNG